jgi:hypothetical protein
MSVTFSKKYHTCSACGHKSNALLAIKYNRDVSSGYPESCRPQQIKEHGIYIEELVRDEYGIVLVRLAKEKPCENCESFSLVADHVDNETPVLNFYPQTEAHKWLDGLGKAGL